MNNWRSLPFKKQIPLAFATCCLFHLLAVIFSEGHHKLDEYGGILMMTANHLGLVGSEFLHPGEYPAQIRPWLQPYIYTLWLKPFLRMGLESPFYQTFLLRLLSSFIGLSSIWFAIQLIPKFVEEKGAQTVALLGLTLLWFYPFIHARTSAENFAMSFFFFGFYLFFHRIKNFLDYSKFKVSFTQSFFAGLFFGCSFIFRFQLIAMITPLFIWALFIAKIRVQKIYPSILGFLLLLGLSTILDSYLYQEWTFTPWNYWKYNIIEKVASSMGVDPFYKYITKGILKGIPPISFFYFFPVVWLLWRRPTHILVWLIIPFFIVHSFIGHKELRFLFPLTIFLPFVFSYFYQERKFFPFKKFLFIFNFIILCIASLKPAYSAIGLHRVIYEQNIQTIQFHKDGIRFFPFYFKSKSFSTNKSPYIFTNRAKHIIEMDHCKKIYSSYPTWIIQLLPSSTKKRSKIIGLFHCSEDSQD